MSGEVIFLYTTLYIYIELIVVTNEMYRVLKRLRRPWVPTLWRSPVAGGTSCAWSTTGVCITMGGAVICVSPSCIFSIHVMDFY
jgi:hypothetical protein